MIKDIQLKNFKCFQNSPLFEFGKINLLTGINGRGKSSLLQSILILSQSAWKSPGLKKLIINDELLELGNFDDIKNSETPKGENIQIQINFDSAIIGITQMEFAENFDNQLEAECKRIDFNYSVENIIAIDKLDNSKQVDLLSELLKRTHYISADRLGPVKYVEKINIPSFVHVGARGENTINILANSLYLANVHDNLYLGEDSKSVLRQAAEWLSYILDGARIEIKGQDKESSVLYMLVNNRNNSYQYKPANVGFGYSYILPLIVTGLIAKVGDTIIIENPEAHLHPKAQSRIAEFFSKVSSCGIQVFIESHSEHILNGLRVSVLDPRIGIRNQDLSIQYFNEDFKPEKLEVDEKGRIANWPNGFFDQQEIDLSNIFKYSR
jgi:predicted ATPase